jgi:hypothetical protein
MYRGEFMANVADVKADITSFNEYQLRELFNHIGEMLTLDTSSGTLPSLPIYFCC